jgi:hypothetical protein
VIIPTNLSSFVSISQQLPLIKLPTSSSYTFLVNLSALTLTPISSICNQGVGLLRLVKINSIGIRFYLYTNYYFFLL